MGIFSFFKKDSMPRAPRQENRQYVIAMIAADGAGERSSLVDRTVLSDAFCRLGGDIDTIALEKCVPAHTPFGECYAIDYREIKGCEPVLAAYFDDGMRSVSYEWAGANKSVAMETMAAFLEHAKVPAVGSWNYRVCRPGRCRKPEPLELMLDGDSYRRPDRADVEAALEMIESGRAHALLLQAHDGSEGYMEVACAAGGSQFYDVEFTTAPDFAGKQRGWRVRTPDGALVRRWLCDYFQRRECPEVSAQWQEFDVEAYFQELADRASDKKMTGQ